MNPWTLLQSALGTSLAFFYDIIPEYGIAIILLTIAVSLLLFPLTVKQTRSMRGMSEIQPEVKKLQKEFKGDREELNKRLQALYKENGVNPAAGCLPMIVQMPIWFALYRVLWQGNGVPEDSALGEVFRVTSEALEAGKAITDPIFDSVTLLGMNLRVKPSEAVSLDNLAGSISYILLIALIMGAGFYQQRQMTRKKKPTDGQEEQSNQMQSIQNVMKFMPIIFGFISWNLVAGLGVYFATSNSFRIAQQAVILRMGDGDDTGKKAEIDSERPPDEPNNSDKGNGPSQHASKKRNRKRRK